MALPWVKTAAAAELVASPASFGGTERGMNDEAKATPDPVGEEKATGDGESQGGAYPNPHTGRDARGGPDTFLGHGGQTEMGYHGTGQLGEKDVEDRDNANSSARSD